MRGARKESPLGPESIVALLLLVALQGTIKHEQDFVIQEISRVAEGQG